MTVDVEREGAVGREIRRNLTNPKVWLAAILGGGGAAAAGMKQPDRTCAYHLTVGGSDGGSWVAIMPENTLASWRFVSPYGGGDQHELGIGR